MTATITFPLLGEPLALDLVNTRILERGEPADLLDRPAALNAWLRTQRHRLDWRGAVTHSDLAAVRALRDTIEALVRARLEQASTPPSALQDFNRALAIPATGARLEWTRSGPQKTAPPAGASRDRLLRTLALDALELLTGTAAGALRECAHPDCRLLFVARNARRRWCSGATCGNRARVSRHYARSHD
ncbi:MAG TPA: ABATE domain-containing protein [Rhodanobacteraceae bacterium]|nr:ABATE domain-containing protein [Rhodanobacteraceae bacterium]